MTSLTQENLRPTKTKELITLSDIKVIWQIANNLIDRRIEWSEDGNSIAICPDEFKILQIPKTNSKSKLTEVESTCKKYDFDDDGNINETSEIESNPCIQKASFLEKSNSRGQLNQDPEDISIDETISLLEKYNFNFINSSHKSRHENISSHVGFYDEQNDPNCMYKNKSNKSILLIYNHPFFRKNYPGLLSLFRSFIGSSIELNEPCTKRTRGRGRKRLNPDEHTKFKNPTELIDHKKCAIIKVNVPQPDSMEFCSRPHLNPILKSFVSRKIPESRKSHYSASGDNKQSITDSSDINTFISGKEPDFLQTNHTHESTNLIPDTNTEENLYEKDYTHLHETQQQFYGSHRKHLFYNTCNRQPSLNINGRQLYRRPCYSRFVHRGRSRNNCFQANFTNNQTSIYFNEINQPNLFLDDQRVINNHHSEISSVQKSMSSPNLRPSQEIFIVPYVRSPSGDSYQPAENALVRGFLVSESDYELIRARYTSDSVQPRCSTTGYQNVVDVECSVPHSFSSEIDSQNPLSNQTSPAVAESIDPEPSEQEMIQVLPAKDSVTYEEQSTLNYSPKKLSSVNHSLDEHNLSSEKEEQVFVVEVLENDNLNCV